ncbi:MAG TPA: fatty acid hydroxylase family protein [Polyangiaceae bacterium]|nr:fatty acid hydroxylase family protein [Polyangiaceae bacterium]
MELIDKTFGVFLDPQQRVFWPGLLIATALAWLAGGQLRKLLAPSIWLHRSARLDYALLFANAALKILLLAPLGLSAYGVAVALVRALDAAFGVPQMQLPDAVVTAIYTVTLFVAWDLSRYLLHRLLHSVPALFAIHKVHHSAEVLTPMTLFRVHPIESALFMARGILVTGVITGLFFYVFRARAIELQLLGVNAIGLLFNALGSNLRHSHVWLSYGPKLERLLISPAQHQIHHGTERADQESNFGTWLAIWDGWAGSLRLASELDRPSRFGLADADQNHDPHGLVSALWSPLSR